MEKNFVCRVCGHTAYEEVRQNNGLLGPGGRSWVDHYYCKGCGVVFLTPTLFSVYDGGEEKNK